MRFHMQRWIFLAVAVALAACVGAPSSPQTVRQVVSTTSFGMCVGYCTTRLEISEGQAVLISNGRDGRGALQNLPQRRIAAELSPSEWQEIVQLAAQTSFEGLPPVIGCPDCADGGAESLSIVGFGEPRSVSFDHGAAIAQAQPMLDRVRAMRARMMESETAPG